MPSKISVLYHNVQGFLTTRELHKENPLLDTKKVSDFQSYVYLHKPDIIILNETWLNKSILDNEIFTNSNYKVFRRDRSALSHPPDILNPKKFKNVAGGVAIAVRSNLDLKPTLVKSTSKSEILSVVLKTNSGKKICITTLYRVGTLEADNFYEVEQPIRSICLSNKVHKHIFIGDIIIKLNVLY